MILYVDAFCGVAGDMLLGGLVDAGVPLKKISAALRKLPVRGYSIRSRRVMRGPVRCTKVDVHVTRHGHHHTPARSILAMIRRSRLPEGVRRNATAIFERLAEAEGKIHGIAASKVAFHEVGAVDSIVDIVGVCIALDLLEVDQLSCSPLPLSRGTVKTDHGLLPVPAPATLELLRGFPTTPSDIEAEIVTPTGAAILSTLVKRPGVIPSMELERIGYGAGDYDLPQRPDFLRILVGRATRTARGDTAVLLETNLDDMTGQEIGFLYERFLAAGALDVFTTPIVMKKSRPAFLLSVLTSPADASTLERILLTETPTFGVRRRLVERTVLDRKTVTVRTRYGPIRVKIGLFHGKTLKASPEYDDLRAAALKHGVPLSRVRAVALASAPRDAS